MDRCGAPSQTLRVHPARQPNPSRSHERRVQGQFQAEAFNAFNHTNLANLNATASSGAFGTITAASSSTGTVNIPSSVGTQRVWLFAAKIIFWRRLGALVVQMRTCMVACN
jgi:hypothetical protein